MELRYGVLKDNLKIGNSNNKLHNENESLKIRNEFIFELKKYTKKVKFHFTLFIKTKLKTGYLVNA